MVIALLNLVVLLLIVGVVYYAVTTWIPLPDPLGKIVNLLFAVIVILLLVDMLYGRHVMLIR